MRLIFSRKGFDSARGGFPSPIFPDGSFCSLPVPSERRPPCLKDVCFGSTNMGAIVQALTGESRDGSMGVHLDPDLNASARPRPPGWRPCFGQVGAAQTHLENQHVGTGDLFLFFGWFREVQVSPSGGLAFSSSSTGIHALFGWLQVGGLFKPSVSATRPPKWAGNHPHVKHARDYSPNNTLYTASEYLQLPGLRQRVPGGGVFNSFHPRLRLTEQGKNRSMWRFPASFYPRPGVPALSYHVDTSRWHRDDKGVLLKTVGRGQEFVLDCEYYPEALEWVVELFDLTLTCGLT